MAPLSRERTTVGSMLAIYSTPDDVAAAVAMAVENEIAASGRLTIGLAGGSTPAAAYERLAERAIDWTSTTLWLGDERWVPANHPDANSGMVRRTLGSAAAQRMIAPDQTIGDPKAAAMAYETLLRSAFADADDAGQPGLVLLGMGDDGHTASLFPGTAALDAVDRWYVANRVEAKDTWRLTATLPLLRSATRLIFIVTGATKAGMVARIVEGDEPFPAQRVAADHANVTWFLDAAAASQLRKTPR
jgi:6-phosphogluconolactonase